MTRQDPLFASRPDRAIPVPAWLDRVLSAGVVTGDREIARRQRLTNVAVYSAIANAGSHLVTNALHDWHGMMVIHAYNALMVLLLAFIPRLHRLGPNVSAVALLTLITAGNAFVSLMLGRDSSLHVYFTLMPAGIMLLVGVENWRVWMPFLIAASAALAGAMWLFPARGFIVPEDTAIRETLGNHAMINAILVNGVMIFYALTLLRRSQQEVETALARSDSLLTVLLPRPIAERLKASPARPIADRLDQATVLFADLVGFTTAAHGLPPEEVVAWLDRVVRDWDDLCAAHGIQKIKTIGDSYMAAAGIAGDGADGAVRMGRFALAMQAVQQRYPPLGGQTLALRIGIHCGPATAGVIGRSRMGYDLWGDAVNMASRMESTGVPGRIQVCETYREATGEAFLFEPRGEVEVKGIGPVATCFITGERGRAPLSPAPPPG